MVVLLLLSYRCIVTINVLWLFLTVPWAGQMIQRRSQNAEKITHIKGRLLDQAMIRFNFVPFEMRTSLKGKNLLPEQFFIVW